MQERRFTWFAKLTDKATPTEAANKAGIDPRTLFDEMQNDSLTASTVVALAKAYGQRTTVALVITEIIPKSDLIDTVSTEDHLQMLTNKELMIMFADRVKENPEGMEKALKESAKKLG